MSAAEQNLQSWQLQPRGPSLVNFSVIYELSMVEYTEMYICLKILKSTAISLDSVRDFSSI